LRIKLTRVYACHFLCMYFPDRGCVHTLLTLYVYATAVSRHLIVCLCFFSLRENTAKGSPHQSALACCSVQSNPCLPPIWLMVDVWMVKKRVTRRDKMRNETVRGILCQETTLIDRIAERRLNWFGHVSRMGSERLPAKGATSYRT